MCGSRGLGESFPGGLATHKGDSVIDPANRVINADDKLMPVFGKKQMSTFELTGILTASVVPARRWVMTAGTSIKRPEDNP